jgi:hypothetical protein
MGYLALWIERLTPDQEEGHEFNTRQGQNLAIQLKVEDPGESLLQNNLKFIFLGYICFGYKCMYIHC